MQALTGLFARHFGTPNYAAHGGFCSVNMAAGMIYTIGGSFWEFGGPDLDRAKLFVMIGTAEDHHSNPMKIALGKFKRAGGRFVSINPVRTGYSAIADEWIPIRPGTDGALFMALLHELIRTDRIDRAFLQRYTNAPQLVVLDDGEREGLFAFDPIRRRARPATAGIRTTSSRSTSPPARSLRRTPRASSPAATSRSRALHAGRRQPRRAVVPAPARAGRGVHAGLGRGDHRHPRGADREARRGARRDGARPGVRAADPVDRRRGAPSMRRRRGGRSRSTPMRGLAAHSNGFQTVRAWRC
jgi:anaerobic selenocysteine-containing dehydrogenase